MKKFKWSSFLIGLAVAASISIGIEAARTDFWTVQGYGSFRNIDVAGIDSTGAFYLNNSSETEVFSVTTGGVVTLTAPIVIDSNAAPRTNLTPTAVGSLVWNTTDGELCISTGTTTGTWALVTSTTTACSS